MGSWDLRTWPSGILGLTKDYPAIHELTLGCSIRKAKDAMIKLRGKREIEVEGKVE